MNLQTNIPTSNIPTYDVAIIGSGPAGYVAAIRAAQLGFKTALIEKSPTLGGTCLNVGCIPSKALLESSHRYHSLVHSGAKHGIEAQGVTFNVPAMIQRKDDVVKQLTGGVAGLMKKNQVTVLQAWATLKGAGHIALDNGDEVTAKHIILATGSTPIQLPFAPFNGTSILSSTEALNLTEVPKHLIVIGAGVIGLEMGSVWGRLGAKVTLIDNAPRPLMVMDADLGTAATAEFTKQGMVMRMGAKVLSVTPKGDKVTVSIEVDGKTGDVVGDKVLVAVGRRANTQGMGLAEAGVAMSERGVIQVDAHYQTSLAGVYAVGDCIPGPMLAHKGEEEGIACVEMLAGQHGHVNYSAIPWVVYTHPEVAGVGLTEDECKQQGRIIRTGKFLFRANGRALAVDETTGFVKVVADATTDELLGVHIFGHNASELVAEAAALIEFKASVEDLARICHAHPTLSEAVKEAALAAGNRAIHS